MRHRCMSLAFLLAVLWASLGLAAAAEDPYEVGGPLAGLRLAPFPTQHGEAPGYPGCFPGSGNDKEGLPAEVELYPGSVEHYRAYMFKYMPIRSFFDRQSQLHNWVAPEIPGAAQGQVEQYAAPVYWPRRHELAVRTDKRLRPVPVVRCKAGAPVFRLDLGELGPGLYVVRVIGAVETKDIRPFRKSLFLTSSVNDGLKGEVSVHRQRLGYCDEFYDVADVYFHAPERRAYRVELQVDAGSQVDLLVHNISLDDVLAGTARRAVKSRPAYPRKPGVAPTASRYTPEERLARDAAIWNDFVPLNVQGGAFAAGGYGSIPSVMPGTDTMTPKEIVEKYGDWAESREPGVLLVNKKLDLKYTFDDLRGRRPLPDPYPFKDDGAGLTYPSESPDAGRVWAPMGGAILSRIRSYMAGDGGAWAEKGDTDAARDGAVRLVRFAYAFPTFDDADMLTSLVHDPGAFGRGDRCRRRETDGGHVLGHFGFQFRLAKTYDLLFDYIRGNEELARSVSRFVPTVKTSQDVIGLLDVYLLQTLAKRLLRYQYSGDGREPAQISEVAAVLGDNGLTDPWMEWLFSRVFYYPRPLEGLPDYAISATDRDGRSTIGSSSYVMSDESAAAIAEALEFYITNGGNPKYDLRDPQRFPKSLTALYFPIRTRFGGIWPMRLGNVSGPDKNFTKAFDHLVGHDAETGWRWTHDPVFAFALKYYGKPDKWSEEERRQIDQAAAGLRRAPWMDNRSRVLPGYAAFLESGLVHDDWRFRRAVMLRVGTGTGHSHHDTLDLQIQAHGLPMTVDAGQRPGYSRPGDAATRLHNTVEVNGDNWSAGEHTGGTNSWVRVLSDMTDAHYLEAQVAPNPLARLARRQVALISVDEGVGSAPLGPQAYGGNPTGLPRGVVTANSYVFDVFRVAGGSTHTYCFHSGVNDLDAPNPPKTNALELRRLGEDKDESDRGKTAADYLAKFSGDRYYGVAPADFEAVFHMQKKRTQEATARSSVGRSGTESFFLGPAYDPKSPDKFVKLHLLGVEGAIVMKGDMDCTQWGYHIPNVYVQKKGPDLQSAFGAVIEPYAGTPFITSVRSLPVAGNEEDALRAVAIEVQTVNGHKDFCFADGRPEKARQVGERTVAAEFAYCSTDAQGLRQASITGGALLTTPEVRLRASAARRTGTITRLDYQARKVWIDAVWPAAKQERLLELKTQPAGDAASWQTGYTAVSAAPVEGGTEITFLRSADFYRSLIASVDERAGAVTALLPVPVSGSGFRRGWTASDDSGRRLWRVSAASDNTFTLTGGPVRAGDFAPANALRLWEYGVGDELRQSTFANLRRLAPGEYELAADVDVEVTFADGAARKVTAEELARNGGVVRFTVGK